MQGSNNVARPQNQKPLMCLLFKCYGQLLGFYSCTTPCLGDATTRAIYAS